MTELSNKYKSKLRLLSFYQKDKKSELNDLLISRIKKEIVEIGKQLADQRGNHDRN